MRLIDLSGKRFGRLTVLSKAESVDKRTIWWCRCDCSDKSLAIDGYCIRRGHTRSCGCLNQEMRAERKFKHGHGKAGELTPEYRTWLHMCWRCDNPNCISYPSHGGRGIMVCERWRDFANFLVDMGERPKGKTLDRYPDNDGNYEPGNCRWATFKEQRANRRDVLRDEERMMPILIPLLQKLLE